MKEYRPFLISHPPLSGHAIKSDSGVLTVFTYCVLAFDCRYYVINLNKISVLTKLNGPCEEINHLR